MPYSTIASFQYKSHIEVTQILICQKTCFRGRGRDGREARERKKSSISFNFVFDCLIKKLLRHFLFVE